MCIAKQFSFNSSKECELEILETEKSYFLLRVKTFATDRYQVHLSHQEYLTYQSLKYGGVRAGRNGIKDLATWRNTHAYVHVRDSGWFTYTQTDLDHPHIDYPFIHKIIFNKCWMTSKNVGNGSWVDSTIGRERSFSLLSHLLHAYAYQAGEYVRIRMRKRKNKCTQEGWQNPTNTQTQNPAIIFRIYCLP